MGVDCLIINLFNMTIILFIFVFIIFIVLYGHKHVMDNIIDRLEELEEHHKNEL